MTKLFQLSADALLEICKKLSPKELLTVASSGENQARLRYLAMKVLFEQETPDAIACQQQMLEFWMANPKRAQIIPQNLLRSTLKHFDFFHQIIGLSILNDNIPATRQALDYYCSYLIRNITPNTSPESLLRQFAPMMDSGHRQTIFDHLQNNLSHKNMTVQFELTRLLQIFASQFDSEQIDTLRKKIQENLQHTDAAISTFAPEQLCVLVSRQTSAQLEPLITRFLGIIQSTRNKSSHLRTLQRLINSFNAQQLSLFMPDLKEMLSQLKGQKLIEAVNLLNTIANRLEPEEIAKLISWAKTDLSDETHSLLIQDILYMHDKNLAPEQAATCLLNVLQKLVYHIHDQKILDTLVHAFANQITQEQIPQIIPALQQKMLDRRIPVHLLTQNTIKALAPKLRLEEVNALILLTENDLIINHHVIDKTLKALFDRLNAEEIKAIVNQIANNMTYKAPFIICKELRTLAALAHKLMPEELAPLIPSLQEHLKYQEPQVQEPIQQQVQAVAQKTLTTLVGQPQNERIAPEIAARMMDTLRQLGPINKKIWVRNLALDENMRNSPNFLDYIKPEDLGELFTITIDIMRTEELYTLPSYPQEIVPHSVLLLHYLTSLIEKRHGEGTKDLLSIIGNNKISEKLRDITLQALSNCIVTLVQAPENNQGLLNSLVQDIDEEVQRIQSTYDKYGTLLQLIKIQIPYAPVLEPESTPTLT